MAIYGLCAVGYWTFVVTHTQDTQLLASVLTTYPVGLVLVAATEVWLRLWPSPGHWPPRLPLPQARRWLMLTVTLTFGVVIGSWMVLLPQLPLIASTLMPLGWPLPVVNTCANAFLALPLLLTASVLGWARWRHIRRRPWHLSTWEASLTLWLLAVDMGLAFLDSHLPQPLQFVTRDWASWPGMLAPILFLAQMAINGFPEEVLCRGLWLPELQTVLRDNIAWALLAMMVMFNAAHLPALLLGQDVPARAWWTLLGGTLFPSQPVGLVMGYLYVRTRSLVPGIALHTFTSLWGILP